MKNPSLEEKYRIRCNLFWDLIGKDSQRGVSLSYSYLANQLGHFSLGFIPSILLNHFIENPFWSSILIIGIWTIFEIINFKIQAIKTKASIKSLFDGFIKQLLSFITFNMYKSYPKDFNYFKFNSWNVLGDTILDIFFFAFGATCAYISMQGWTNFFEYPYFTFVVIFSIIYGLVWFWWWYKKKIYLQNATFPNQKRLASWTNENNLNEKFTKLNNGITIESESEIKHINLFINYFKPLMRDDDGSLGAFGNNESESIKKNWDLYIGGPAQLGKTDLAVAIGTEIILNFHKKVKYLTLIDFLENYCVQNPHSNFLEDFLNYYDLVIIDEINAGCEIEEKSINKEYETQEKSYSLIPPKQLIKFISPIFTDPKISNLFEKKIFIFVIGLGKEKLGDYSSDIIDLIGTNQVQNQLKNYKKLSNLLSNEKNTIDVKYQLGA